MSTPDSTLKMPDKQKAWLVTGKGEPAQVLRFDESVPVPSKLAPGEVLIKVQAAALNPVGYKSMELVPTWLSKRPYVAEMDFSGVVVDSNGTDLSNGQEIFGIVADQSKSKQGALAEYIRVPRTVVTPRPSNISAVEAAGIACVALTADHALFHIAQLEPGQSVFINGGSTAVGIFAVQMAKAIGCTVTASASSQREEFLKNIGVDHFIDYTKGPVHEQLERNPPEPKFHVFLEAVGNTDVEMYTHSAAYLAPGGVFISVGPQPAGWKGMPRFGRYVVEALLRPKVLGGVPRKWKLIIVPPKSIGKRLENIAQSITEGKVKPIVDSIYPFEDALKAYSRIMTKHSCGKIVVKVDPEAF